MIILKNECISNRYLNQFYFRKGHKQSLGGGGGLSNSTAHCERAFTTNTAEAFILLTFSKMFKTFFIKYCKIWIFWNEEIFLITMFVFNLRLYRQVLYKWSGDIIATYPNIFFFFFWHHCNSCVICIDNVKGLSPIPMYPFFQNYNSLQTLPPPLSLSKKNLSNLRWNIFNQCNGNHRCRGNEHNS